MAAILTLLHTSFGAAGEKSRANRFGAMGKSCLLSVVTTNFLLPLALMPWRCISLAHAFLAHSNAFARAVTCPLPLYQSIFQKSEVCKIN